MNTIVIFALFAMAASSSLRSSRRKDLMDRLPVLDSHLDKHWEQYKETFEKEYNGKEETTRRLIWEDNVAEVIKHNIEADIGRFSYHMGINKYSDMAHEEFIRTMAGYREPESAVSNATTWLTPENVEIPANLDWTRYGRVTGIKDQGLCGSCWAFASTGTLEGQHKRKTGRLISLSEQNLVDCSRGYGNNGCNGGWMPKAYEYIGRNGGIDSENSYRYQARDDLPCRFNRANVAATLTGYVTLPKGNEEALKVGVATVGPIAVAVDSNHDSFRQYKNGIYFEPRCNAGNLNHAVLVVGYGTYNGVDYWLIKNSWGKSWGVNGYMFMARNRNNHCGIASFPSYPLV